ncbi:extensin family protein [Paracoccus sp. SCSIO 75233]|uniref:extensin-like domain-containing protein n=1 Tax=Paracoccus sp. SCSIO 75233 TaxID=3017782 RepID=UPI0022EFFB74|nr:extensin family protein [Paracoccus sp. SCSIO 75233]WBU53446.1 extensin family protein [Paracoccus sp. SCSIO 75233]
MRAVQIVMLTGLGSLAPAAAAQQVSVPEAVTIDATRPPDRPAAAGDSPPAVSMEAVPEVEPEEPAWAALAEDGFGFRSCLLELDLLKVGYEALQPIRSADDPDCGIARPVRISTIQPDVEIVGGAEMRCETAHMLALWVRDELQPAARRLPGRPGVTGLVPGSTYQCRARVGGRAERLSEHALGNAFDIAAFRLSDGSELPVAPRDETGDLAEAFQKAVRYGACPYFSTVLGPGSNAAHDNHLHFDVIARGNGWRICE